MTNDTYLDICFVSVQIIDQIRLIKKYELSLSTIVSLNIPTTYTYRNVLVFKYIFTYFMLICFMLVPILYDDI
jgi:hypothetical protein